MRNALKKLWTDWKAWLRAQSRIGRLCVWLAGIVLVCVVLCATHIARGPAIAIAIVCLVPLSPLSLILLYRWITRRVFWKVRNRLIVTYLLMGLAPIVLFSTLGGIALYLFGGQYLTNTAETLLEEATLEVGDETMSAATYSLVGVPGHVPPPVHDLDASGHPRTQLAVLKNGVWQPLFPGMLSPFADLAPPAWLHAPFRGVVAHGGKLYLCAEAGVQQGNGMTLVLGSRLLDSDSLAHIENGLGKVTLFANDSDYSDNRDESDEAEEKPAPQKPAAKKPAADEEAKDSEQGFDKIKGGEVPQTTSALDAPVIFTAPITVSSWQTGKPVGAMEVVISRPTVLYRRLFARSVTTGVVVKAVLAGTGFAFALLELLAVGMAIAMSRTITRSVAELTRGTQEIDKGNLAHRVRASRKDQLGDLARSFNGMAQSIGDLLEQQRDKDRLLNEIAIAQEVQATLFPASPASMPGLEMHAVCLPAQTVGGDYYDFIFGPNGSLCLALGDISGKGISAALLMASLHSAVRAFSLDGSGGDLLSPAILLEDINRHLFQSTQSARYATLFVACYDAHTQRLTYSNGGHLPPLVLSPDGTVRRLDVGGPVVGLLGGMKYSEASIELAKGDLLIAFTDGITEPEKGVEEFGEARLLECVRRNAILPLPEIMSGTLDTLQRWIGENEQPDDITLLLARQL